MADRITDIGPPKFDKFLPPVIKDNYGKWKYHEILEPGVLMHVSESGAKIFSVRGGSGRLVTTDFIKEVCDVADKFCDGYLRFTSRNNVEFLLSDQGKIAGVKDACKQAGHPHRRHRPLRDQHRPHPGLGPLPHPGHRRLGHRQGRHGRPVRVLRQPQAAGPGAHRPGLLPQHVRRGALLRHRHPGDPPHAAQSQPREAAPPVRNSHHHRLLVPPAPSGPIRTRASRAW